MAVSVDTVYQRVLAIANKEQRGYITPQEYNLLANQAQMSIFEQYFYDINQFGRQHGNDTEYSDMLDVLNKKLAPFQKTSDALTYNAIPLTFTLPNDTYRLGTVITNNSILVEEVQQNDILEMNMSKLTKPNNKRPVYVRTGFSTIQVHDSSGINASFGGSCTYTKKPLKPSWGYVVVNGKAMYNPSNKVDFELHPAEENELVYKILKFAGVSMKRDNVTRIAQGLELSQVQQEKQ